MTATSGPVTRGVGASGYVDARGTGGTRFSGWVAARPDGTPPEIRVRMFENDVPHRLTIGDARPDVTSRAGIQNFRFRIELTSRPHHGALVSGDLCVTADGRTLLLGTSLRADDTAEASEWFKELTGAGMQDDSGQSTGLARPPRPEGADQVSLVPLPVGTRSLDGSAVIGTGGNLFVYGGSNTLWQRYGAAREPAEASRTADEVSRWVGLLRQRAQKLQDQGMPFVQTVVPEKSTSIPSGVAQLSGATRALIGIEEQLSDAPWYVSGRRAIPVGDDPSSWLRLDSHLSPAGALALSSSLIRAVVPSARIPAVEFSGVESLEGDLTARFFGQVVAEVVAAPNSPELDALGSSARLTHSADPDRGGRFVGLRRVWRNDAAPLALRSVVFGNSFFGSNPRTASRCNYWFLRMFQEHHFVWSPELDYDYLDQIGPDVVICQTNERFLSTVPLT